MVELFTVQFLSEGTLKVLKKLVEFQYLVFNLYSQLFDLVSVHFLGLHLEHCLSSRVLLIELTLNVFIAKSLFFLKIHLLQLLFLIIQLFILSDFLHFESSKLSNQKYLFLMFEPFVLYFV
jgi:hypothetical protein